jgi:imidazolonepropionase-like amidohydrolase
VAVHSTLPDTGQLVTAGVDSIEHGIGLDEAAIREMARRGTVRTPAIGALPALLEFPDLPPSRRQGLQQGLARLAGLLPLAARLASRETSPETQTAAAPS